MCNETIFHNNDNLNIRNHTFPNTVWKYGIHCNFLVVNQNIISQYHILEPRVKSLIQSKVLRLKRSLQILPRTETTFTLVQLDLRGGPQILLWPVALSSSSRLIPPIFHPYPSNHGINISHIQFPGTSYQKYQVHLGFSKENSQWSLL